MRRWGFGLLLALCACTHGASGAAVAAKARKSAQGRHLRAKSGKMNPAALLLELVPELQHEAQAGLRLMATRTKWCRSVHSHRQKMAAKLREQLDEGNAEQKQLDTDERRLTGERATANTFEAQEQAQLKESTSLANLATETYLKERRQMNQSLEAAGTAMRLLRLRIDAKSSQDSQLSNSDFEMLGQLSDTAGASRMTLEKVERGHTSVDELMQELVALDSQLRADAADADKDHLAVSEKLRVAQERLTSSILQAQSQAAMAKMDLAERDRRHARINSEVLSVSALLEAVEASDAAVTGDCDDKSKQRKLVGELIAAEVGAVKDVLGRLPSRDSEWLTGVPSEESAPAFLQVAPASGTAAHSALKVLDKLSHSFPDESPLYEKAAQQLSFMASADVAPSMTDATAVAAPTPAVDDKDDSEAANPLQNIQQFAASGSVADSSQAAPAVDRDVGRVQGTYSSLLGRVLTAEQAASNRSAWCAIVSKSTAADGAALEYASRQADAKLQLAQSQIGDCKLKTKYDLEQGKVIETQLEQSRDLEQLARREREAFIDTLGKRSKQLSTLVVEFDQKAAPEEQELARRVSDILHILERHRALLQQGQSSTRSDTAEHANHRIFNLLASRIKYSKSRLIQREREARSLSAISRARVRVLSGTSGDLHGAAAAAILRLCESSEAAVQSLTHQEHELRNLVLNSTAAAL